MAKKRVENNIETVDQADATLRDLAIASQFVQEKQSIYNQMEQAQRSALAEEIDPIKGQITAMEKDLKVFAESNRGDFPKDTKTLSLTHGDLAFRLAPPSVKFSTGFKTAAVIDLIKGKRSLKAKLLVEKWTLNKEAVLRAFSSGEIKEKAFAGVGIKIEQQEKFYYETDLAVGDDK